MVWTARQPSQWHSFCSSKARRSDVADCAVDAMRRRCGQPRRQRVVQRSSTAEITGSAHLTNHAILDRVDLAAEAGVLFHALRDLLDRRDAPSCGACRRTRERGRDTSPWCGCETGTSRPRADWRRLVAALALDVGGLQRRVARHGLMIESTVMTSRGRVIDAPSVSWANVEVDAALRQATRRRRDGSARPRARAR